MAEHLFFPDEPPKPLSICYDGPLYDGGDWDTYPTRQGWESEPGTQKFRPGATPQEYHPMISCWLYFGMLHYVFGDELDQADFLRTDGEGEGDGKDGQRQYLTSKHLERYIGSAKDWKKKSHGARSVEIIKKVCEQLPRYSPYLSAEICFAIQLACHALWHVTVKRDGPQDRPRSVQNWMFLRANHVEQMVKDGWCPLDAEKCRKAGGEVDTPAYLLQLVRTKPAWNKRNHELCNKTECVADNVDESLYVTRHVQEDCGCEHVHADIQTLHEILESGGIPLVEITPPEEDSEHYAVKVVKKRTSKRYVSVSHVWADGLGNPHSNSLPNCQLGLLYERARMLLTDKEYTPQYQNGPFGALHTGAARFAHRAFNSAKRGDNSVLVWIDTLCIPHAREVRSLAIQRIRDVYVGAYRTMLLDSEIRQVDSQSASNLELCLRVLYCSGWIRRLWTLQEGLAATSKLYVILSDKAVNVSTIADELLTKLDQGKIPVFQERIARFAAGVWYSYFQHTIDYSSKFEKFVGVFTSPFIDASISQDQLIAWNWFNVATRASSKDGDRPIVLAGVLNVDVGEILKVKGSDERMRKFYSMLDGFPKDVLFQQGPRFEEDGMRWAVRVCRYTDEIQYLAHGPGKITPRGLQIAEAPSWTFPSPRVFDVRTFDDDDGQSAWEEWLRVSEIDPDVPATVLLLKTKEPVDFHLHDIHGIILEESKNSRPGALRRCALVSVQTTDDGLYYGRYTSVGTIQSVRLGLGNFPEEGYFVGSTWDDLQKRDWVVG